MNYYQRHLGDYARDTGDLTMLQHGAFTLLLDRYYADERPIKAGKVYQITKARNKAERAATDFVLSEYFTLRDGVYLNAKVDSIIAAAKKKSELASESAKSRWINDVSMRTHSDSDADALRIASERNASHKPLTSNQEDQELLPPSLRAGSPAGDSGAPPTDLLGAPVAPVAVPAGKQSGESLAETTRQAMESYNSILARPFGALAPVTDIGPEKKRQWVARCLKVARQISADQFDSPQITPEFWRTYFTTVSQDPFRSGRQSGGSGHENWKPSFEYLTREKTMIDVFEKALGNA